MCVYAADVQQLVVTATDTLMESSLDTGRKSLQAFLTSLCHLYHVYTICGLLQQFLCLRQRSAAGGIMFSGCSCVCASVCASKTTLLTLYLEKYWAYCHQTFSFAAFWDKNEGFKAWDQTVKVQGHGGSNVLENALFGLVNAIFCLHIAVHVLFLTVLINCYVSLKLPLTAR